MKKKILTLATLLTMMMSASAQEEAGDIILSTPSSQVATIRFFGKDGVVHRTLGSAGGAPWTAAALLNDGGVVVHDTNSYRSVQVYDAANVYVHGWHYTPQYFTTDLDVLSDGTILICSRLEGLLHYQQDGTQLPTIVVPGMNSANGLQVQDDDTIWIADLVNFNNNTEGRIYHIDSTGAVLHTFPTTYDPGDVAIAPNGDVWVSSTEGLLSAYDTQGNLLHQFEAQLLGSDREMWSLAVDGDGIVWASGYNDLYLRGYDWYGNVLAEVHTGFEPATGFISAVPGSTLDRALCFGDGSEGVCPCGNFGVGEAGCRNSNGTGGRLDIEGLTSITTDSLELWGTNLPANQTAIAFVGMDALSGGTGAGVPFGDGLRCAGNHIQRLGIKMTSSGGEANWGPGLGGYNFWAAGDTRYFQTWYSDPLGPCSSGFNLTNAVEVTFIP